MLEHTGHDSELSLRWTPLRPAVAVHLREVTVLKRVKLLLGSHLLSLFTIDRYLLIN